MQLIRQEALDAKLAAPLGCVDLSDIRTGRWSLAVAGFVIAALTCVVTFGEISRRENASGTIVSSEGLVDVRSPDRGTVIAIHVAEGDVVEPGQLLAEVQVEAAAGTSEIGVATRIAAGLAQQRALYELQLDSLRRSGELRSAALREQLAILDKRSSRLDERRRILEAEREDAANLLSRVERVAGASLTALQLHQYRANVRSVAAQLSALEIEVLELEASRTATRSELDSLPLAIGKQNSAIARSIAQISQEAASNDSMRSVQLRAPRAGVVAAMVGFAGQRVEPEDQILSLIPSSTPLQADLWVSSDAIGFLEPGMPVSMRYRAFPHRRYGRQQGTVLSVAQSTLPVRAIERVSGMTFSQPMYRVRVELMDQWVTRPGSQPRPLRIGMRVDGDIVLERIRILERLLGSDRPALGSRP